MHDPKAKKTFTVTVSRDENREEKNWLQIFYAVDIKIDIEQRNYNDVKEKLYDDE